MKPYKHRLTNRIRLLEIAISINSLRILVSVAGSNCIVYAEGSVLLMTSRYSH